MAEVYGKDNYLMTDDDCYDIELLDMDNKEPKTTVAYIMGDYYYLYRGEKSQYEFDRTPGMKPGIYKLTDKNNEIYRVDPITEDEKKRYRYDDKIGSVQPNNIVGAINANKSIIVQLPEYNKISFANIGKEDDLFKRLIKTAFNKKGIGVDDCESGFADKNARFNFKQAVTGPNRLSIMYFDRGCEALGIGYEIRLYDRDPSNPIGAPLTEPIVMGTEDTFNL